MTKENRRLEKAQSILQAIRYMESIDSEAAYEKGMAAIREERRRKAFRGFVWAAACLSIPLLAATAILVSIHYFPSESKQMASVTAPRGAVVKYELPDNSTVWLNSGSTLTYPIRFDRKTRRVQLEGEAYFEVQANPEKPFLVNTSDELSVKVYGTRFNVEAYSDDDIITTTLEHGHVDVLVEGHEALCLVPGEQAEYSKLTGELVRSQVNTYESTAWKDGRMVLRNASLNEVFKALERKFGVSIQVNGTIDETDTYRATFRNETLAQILDYLSATADFRWKIEDTTLPGGEFLPGNLVCIEMK